MKLFSPPNVAIAASLFVLNLALNVPLFESGETRFRDSIEGGYASMARFIAAHPHPWGWNPTQYCGLPTQFTYVPGLPYLAALFIRLLPGASPEHVYRVVAATLACLGPSTLFLALVVFTGSRWWSLAAALAYTLFSPLYGLIPTVDRDRGGGVHLPWRLQVLVKYGEGPHNVGLTLIPLALAALWAAAKSAQFWRLFLAAALIAAVALTNWVAALALAFCCLMLLLATLGTQAQTGFRASRAFVAAALAYGLACFWLTPSFIRTIAFNWPTDAFNYHLQQQERLLLVGLVAGVVAVRLLFQWLFPGEIWLCFLGLCFFGFAWVVEWFYSTGVGPIPESRRYALELEMFLVLFVVEVFRGLWSRGTSATRACAAASAAVMMAAGWNQVSGYVRQGHAGRRPSPKEQTIEYRLAKSLADLHPRGRVFASGGLRFRLNSWFDIPQIGGGFESGLRNRIPLHFAYQVRTGIGSKPQRDGHDAADQLRSLGVEYVVVHGPKSREHYRDYKNPTKFDGVLEVVHREEDDTIYRLPFTSLAHLIRPDELPPYPPIGGYLQFLRGYVVAIDDAARPKLNVEWRGSDKLQIDGPVTDGMLVALMVSYDGGWKARQDGRSIAIEPDKLGMMTLRVAASPKSSIELVRRATLEQWAMAAVCAAVWVMALRQLWKEYRGARA